MDRLDGRLDQMIDPINGEPESVDRTLQPLEQIDTHQAADTLLTALLGQACPLVVGEFLVFGEAGGHDVVSRGVDGQVEGDQQPIDLVIVDGVPQVCQTGAQGDGLEPLRKFADVGGIVILLNVPAGAGDGHAVQHFEEIKVQHIEQGLCGPPLRRKTAPFIEGLLRPAEDLVNGGAGIQFLIDLGGVPLIGQGQLVLQVDEPIVDRGGGKHQDLCADACPDHFVHQFQIAVLFGVFTGDLSAVAEVVALVNDHQIVVAPIQPIQFEAVGLPVLPGQVGMVQYVIPQAVLCDGVVHIVALVGVPVF